MQESKYISINSQTLFEEFKSQYKNLKITDQGLSLSVKTLYKPGEEIFNDKYLELRDVDTDECDTLYILDRRSMSILTYHKDFKKLQFPAYKPGILAPLIEEPKGIAVDNNSLYLIGTVRVHEEGKKEGIVALGKKDLKVRWAILKGPEGFPFKELTDLDKDSFGDLYVLEKGRHRILKISSPGKEKSFLEIGKEGLHKPENIYVDSDDSLHIFDEKTGYMVLGLDGKIGKKEIGAPVKEIIIRRRAQDSKKNMYVIIREGENLRFLEYVEENNPNSEGIFRGTYLSKAIDSRTQNNCWYRFILQGNFPEGTTVEFHYYISEELQDENVLKVLPNTEWKETQWQEWEGQKWDKWEDGFPGSSALQGECKRDALFRSENKGRYLWFRITLTGTEKLSPVVSSVTFFSPKISYLEYLPSVYREDSLNRDFLERFLSIFESIFFELDFTIDHLSVWLDAKGTPPEFLEWLGSWIGAYQQNEGEKELRNISEVKRREFISQAIPMYKERGTRAGLEKAILFYTGKKPIIIENFTHNVNKNMFTQSQKDNQKTINKCQNWDYDQENEIKENEDPETNKFLFFPSEEGIVELTHGAGKIEVTLHDALFGKEKFSFYILFKEALEEPEFELIKNIVEEQKPAYTTCKIKVLEPWFYLDGYTYLGINTQLKLPQFLLGKYSILGRDTVLGIENGPYVSEKSPDTGIIQIQADQAISGKNFAYYNRRFGYVRR